MGSIGVAEISVILAALLFFAVGARVAKTRSGLRIGPRIGMFFLGALLSEAYFFVAAFSRSSYSAIGSLSVRQHASMILPSAISALILYEILRIPLSRLTLKTFPVFVVAAWYLHRITGIASYLVTAALTGRLSDSTQSYYLSLNHWIVPKLSSSYVALDFLTAALLVAAAYYLTFGPARSRGALNPAAGSAYGASKMSTDETTRLLSASAFVRGQSFRKKVLAHFEDRNCAFAPEIGLDVSLVAQVCQFAETREMRYLWYFLVVGLAAGILAGANPALGIAVGVIASIALYLRKSGQERTFVRHYFQRGNFDPAAARNKFPANLDHGAGFPVSAQNLLIYKGFTPFVGAGVNLGGWSFTVDIDKPGENDFARALPPEPIPFEVNELYTAINDAIHSLRLDRMNIDDYCFVNGAEIRDDRQVLPNVFGRPIQRLDQPSADAFKKTSDPRIRHYQWVRVHDWGNELVMSYFLRCALRGSSLFVEINRFLLTPLSAEYHAADSLAQPSFAEFFTRFIKSVIIGPLFACFAALLLFAKFNEFLEHLFNTKNRRRRKEIECNPLYNYGAQASLRQMLSSGYFSHYFQKLDGDFYTKVLEHQILDSVVDFLDEHNINTSEIRERRTTILNSGVIVQGGDVRAESLAVGAGATAVKSQSSAPKRRPAVKGAAA